MRNSKGQYAEVTYDMDWIESHSEPVTESGCWIWSGYQHPKTGYGYKRVRGGKNYTAHRFVFNIANGFYPVRPNVVMHTCDNRLCVNPAHLTEGTQKKNLQDMVDRGRGGSTMFKKVISEEVREEIRNAIGTHEGISKIYGISQSTVTNIKNGKDTNRTKHAKLTK